MKTVQEAAEGNFLMRRLSFSTILCDLTFCVVFDSPTGAPSHLKDPPSSPLKSKPENVRVFRRSNKTIYTAGKLKCIFL